MDWMFIRICLNILESRLVIWFPSFAENWMCSITLDLEKDFYSGNTIFQLMEPTCLIHLQSYMNIFHDMSVAEHS